jgi:hypothetical protein
MIADAAPHAITWTTDITHRAAERTVQAGNTVKDAAVNTTNKAMTWTADVSKSAAKNIATFAKGYVGDAKIVGDFVGEKASDAYDNLKQNLATKNSILSPILGGKITENPVQGYTKDQSVVHSDKNVKFFSKPSQSVFDEDEALSSVFEIRRTYITPPLVNLAPHVSSIAVPKGESPDDVNVFFNKPPMEFTQKLKVSNSINLFVHGFNVDTAGSIKFRQDFVDPMEFMGYSNINALVSWSGDVGSNAASKAAYFGRTVESANMTGAAMSRIEDFIRSQNPDIRINTATHSLGARVVLNAAKEGVNFDTVVLLVPAVDNEALSLGGEFAEAIRNIDNLVVVYSRNQEFVFGTAYKAAKFDRPLGYTGPSGNVEHKSFTAIDATDVRFNKFNMSIDDHGDIFEEATLRMIIEQMNRPEQKVKP